MSLIFHEYDVADFPKATGATARTPSLLRQLAMLASSEKGRAGNFYDYGHISLNNHDLAGKSDRMRCQDFRYMQNCFKNDQEGRFFENALLDNGRITGQILKGNLRYEKQDFTGIPSSDSYVAMLTQPGLRSINDMLTSTGRHRRHDEQASQSSHLMVECRKKALEALRQNRLPEKPDFEQWVKDGLAKY